MALVREFEKLSTDQYSVHDPVKCTYSVFTGNDGNRYIQLDTYGSSKRKIRGKKSQSIQLSVASVETLLRIFEQEGFK